MICRVQHQTKNAARTHQWDLIRSVFIELFDPIFFSNPVLRQHKMILRAKVPKYLWIGSRTRLARFDVSKNHVKIELCSIPCASHAFSTFNSVTNLTYMIYNIILFMNWNTEIQGRKVLIFIINIFKIIFQNYQSDHCLTDTGEKVHKWMRVFLTRRWVILVARTRRKKEEENSVSTFGRFCLWKSFESSPVSVDLAI